MESLFLASSQTFFLGLTTDSKTPYLWVGLLVIKLKAPMNIT